MIKVRKPGLATSVQDLGREGYYHLGIPPSGALDQYALSAANHLVGNPSGAAGLECTLIGPELEFRQDALVALSGALMSPRLDGEVVHQDTAFQVRAGQVLRFEFPKAGARTYLAVAGGIEVPLVLGSRSTYTLGALGGFQGRRLQEGDELPIGEPSGEGRAGNSLPMALRRSVGGDVTLRVVPGLYYERLTDAAKSSFFCRAMDRGFRGGPHRLSLQRRQRVELSATGATVWRGVRPVEYRRQLLPDWLDPGAGGAGADCVAQGCGVGRWLRDDRHGDQCGPGLDRADAAEPAGGVCGGDVGRSAGGAAGVQKRLKAMAGLFTS